jgi:hypothetical protein
VTVNANARSPQDLAFWVLGSSREPPGNAPELEAGHSARRALRRCPGRRPADGAHPGRLWVVMVTKESVEIDQAVS